MFVRGVLRKPITGAPVDNGTIVEIRREVDNSLIATVTTTDGEFSYQQNGNPGPYRLVANVGGDVIIRTSKTIGTAGALNMGAMALFWRVFSDGYVPDVYGEMQVTAAGAGMNVTVAAGAALVAGILHDQYSSQNLLIAAADTQPRIDLVVVRVVPPGVSANTEGKTELLVKKGTPAAAPVPPSLTQSSSIWEWPIAEVRVNNGVSIITSDKITDRRLPARSIILDNSITTDMLVDGAVTLPKLTNEAKALYAIKQGNTNTIVQDGNRLNFAQGFDVAVSPQFATQADVTPNTEFFQDLVGAMFVDSPTVDVSYNDTAGTISMESAQQIYAGKWKGAAIVQPLDRINAQLPLYAEQDGTFPNQMNIRLFQSPYAVSRETTATNIGTAWTALTTATVTLNPNVGYRFVAIGFVELTSTGSGKSFPSLQVVIDGNEQAAVGGTVAAGGSRGMNIFGIASVAAGKNSVVIRLQATRTSAANSEVRADNANLLVFAWPNA